MSCARLLPTAALLAVACGPDKGTGDDSTTITPTTTATPTTAGDDSTTGEPLCSENTQFTAAWTAWQKAIADKGATYFYTVRRSPGGFVGENYCIYRTLIAVTDGQISERRFEVAELVGAPDCEPSFIEKGAELGTHIDEFLAAPITVDALYTGCCDDVIHVQPAEDYSIQFAVDEAGLMARCYYLINSCGESCDGGPLGQPLTFETLQFGAPPPAP